MMIKYTYKYGLFNKLRNILVFFIYSDTGLNKKFSKVGDNAQKINLRILI